ncbi:MAG TPA: ABC transporter substrate-binding protein [Pyrinomonadaceae bacterium]|nr:ABC transporter substrate-binding protein [Pyrinomonadaceae bacterium]
MTPPTPLRRNALALVFLSLFVYSCGQQPAPTVQNTQPEQRRERTVGSRGGTLSYRLTSAPKTLNPVLASDEASFLVAFFLTGARLVEFDHDAQRYVPGLAESHRLLDDGRTVELTLRDGVKFSDGHALTTEDVVFTLRSVYDEKSGSTVIRSGLLIGERPIEALALDARRMQLVFPDRVTVPESFLSNIAVVPRHALEAAFNADAERNAFREVFGAGADPKSIVTAGAFAFESVTPGERYVLRRNPHYWKRDSAGTQLPYLDSLALEVVADANAAVTRLGEGSLDMVDRVRPSDFAALRTTPGRVRAVDLGPGLSTDYFFFNLNEDERAGRAESNPVKLSWFKDARFRRAVAHAIDRQSIAEGVLQGLATPLYGFVSPANKQWRAEDTARPEFDAARSRALLAEAGFQTRGTPDAPELFDAQGNRVGFTLLVPQENEPRVKMAAVVQEDLSKIGIRVQVAPVEFNEVRRRTLQSFDYDAALLGSASTDFDPSSMASILSSSSAEHQWRPSQAKPATEWEARIDELLAVLAREPDEARRRGVFREIQAILAEQMPVVPLVSRHIACAANERVGNHRPSIVFPFSMWNAEELYVRQ